MNPFRYLFGCCILGIVLLNCGSDTLAPTLSDLPESSSSVSRPVLRTTLPASWDENWFASPAVYDLNNDDTLEIIASRHSVLYVWNGISEKLKWSAPVGQNASGSIQHGKSRMYCSPVVGDLDGDGLGEIAVSYSNKAAVYDHTGRLQAGWPQTFPGSSGEIRSIAAADLDNNGTSEILVVKTSDGPVTNIWNIDGSQRSGWPQVKGHDYGGYNQNIGAADLDNDGLCDVIATYDRCTAGFFHADGTGFLADSSFSDTFSYDVPLFHDISLARQGWGPDMNNRDELTNSPPCFADIDQDGLKEIVLFSDHERAGEYKNLGNSLWVLNSDMSRPRGFERPLTTAFPLFTGYRDNIVQVAPSPCISTLGTSRPYIVVPSYDGLLRCYSPKGHETWSVRFDNPGSPFIGASEAVAADLDGDGFPEVVFTTYSTDVNQSHLFVLSARGSLLHRISLSGRGSMSAPTISDIDGDGVLEIVLSLKDVLGNGTGGVQIWDVPSAENGTVDWPTGRGNYLRTGDFQG